MQRPKKFTVQTRIMDFSSKISHIVNTAICMKHGVGIGMPCWIIASDTTIPHNGVCNDRVRKVYDGQISQTSVANKRPQKETR